MRIFFQRFLVIFILAITTIVIAYSCAAINKVSNYHLTISEVINRQYVSDNQASILVFYSEEEAYLSNESDRDVYKVEAKNNLFYLTKENKDVKHILIPLSKEQIFWQNKNIYLNSIMEE